DLRRCGATRGLRRLRRRLLARQEATAALTGRIAARRGMYAARPRPGRDEDMSDWTTDAADAIDSAVGLVRERTVEPIKAVARAAARNQWTRAKSSSSVRNPRA